MRNKNTTQHNNQIMSFSSNMNLLINMLGETTISQMTWHGVIYIFSTDGKRVIMDNFYSCATFLLLYNLRVGTIFIRFIHGQQLFTLFIYSFLLTVFIYFIHLFILFAAFIHLATSIDQVKPYSVLWVTINHYPNHHSISSLELPITRTMLD